MPKGKRKPPRIALFGHFGAANLGNEATLQAMLCNVRRLIPDAQITCICTGPEIVAADYHIATCPISPVVVNPWNLTNPVAKLVRKAFIGIPSELYRWVAGIRALWGTDALIVVGTGLLTDAFGIGAWGPYSSFKWSLIARLSGCRVVFLSVGAGPLERRPGRLFAKSALSLADFRSYRDKATLEYLKDIGFRLNGDRLHPDLAFSLPPAALPNGHARMSRRPVVGLGIMEHGAMYGIEKTTSADYSSYLETLVKFAKWLLSRGYDLRLLIGDRADIPAMQGFKLLLRERSVAQAEDRIVADAPASATELLSQLDATDLVVGTRFHNVLLALLLNKPSIAISFHHKCSSLMEDMGLSEYCQDIHHLNADALIQRFCQLEKNAQSLRNVIAEKVADRRQRLDEQYHVIFKGLLSVGTCH